MSVCSMISHHSSRVFSLNWAVSSALNPGHAERLARRLRGRRCTVNLIPWNPSPELPYLRPSPGGPEAFRDALASRGVVATVRWSRGLDGDAACGQLRHRHAAGA